MTPPVPLVELLDRLCARPRPFATGTAADLWTDEHVSARMLAFHLDGTSDTSSRSFAFIDRSVEWITSRFHVGTGTRIADFGCGPGLYCTRFARRGAEVLGIDFSSRSIEHARRSAQAEGLSVRYVEADYLQFVTDERFDLVLMIMCDICVLSPAQRERMLNTFREILRPGGAVLLDAYSLHAFETRKEASSFGANLMDGFWSPKRYFGFHETLRYEGEKVVLDKYTIVESDRVRSVHNWLQYFDPEALRADFARAGFAQTELLGDVAGAGFDASADEFAIVARTGGSTR